MKTVEYLPKIPVQGEPISSSRIRCALVADEMKLAHQLLGKS